MTTFNIIDPKGDTHYCDLPSRDRALWAATVCLERFRCGTMTIEERCDGELIDRFNILRDGTHYEPEIVAIHTL